MGYNTLHNIQLTSPDPQAHDDEFSHDLPDCKRVWTWLFLCEDKTVITVNEDPWPFRSGPFSHQEQRCLVSIRRNLINVFRQCSKARDPMAEITPLVLPLRTRIGDSEQEAQHRASDVPGLLFYYLFDDWLSIYSLIARSDNRYAVELNNLVSPQTVPVAVNIVERTMKYSKEQLTNPCSSEAKCSKRLSCDMSIVYITSGGSLTC